MDSHDLQSIANIRQAYIDEYVQVGSELESTRESVEELELRHRSLMIKIREQALLFNTKHAEIEFQSRLYALESKLDTAQAYVKVLEDRNTIIPAVIDPTPGERVTANVVKARERLKKVT
jgi:hypothetical protein